MRLYILGLAQKEEKRVELWPHMLRSVLQIHGKDKPNHKLRVLSWTLLSPRWEQINRPVWGNAANMQGVYIIVGSAVDSAETPSKAWCCKEIDDELD